MTLSKTTSSRLFQSQRVCKEQFQINESGRKFSKRVENTVEKGEIAYYDQFLPFQKSFQKKFVLQTCKKTQKFDWKIADEKIKLLSLTDLPELFSLAFTKLVPKFFEQYFFTYT